jgi:hypothetical protein
MQTSAFPSADNQANTASYSIWTSGGILHTGRGGNSQVSHIAATGHPTTLYRSETILSYFITYTRLEVFMAVKVKVEVFWIMMSYNVMVGYHLFRGPCCLHLYPEDAGRKVLQNTGILLQHYVVP